MMTTSAADSSVVKFSSDLASFLDRYRNTLRNVFHGRTNIDQLSLKRRLPPFAMREIRSCDPLSVWIPKQYGGRGGHIHEAMAMLATTSYESLALSLAFGINGALFLQPVAKYAEEEIKKPIFRRFLEDKHMGGLMITEPDYGSDALNMQTSYVERDGRYHIQGLKHWGGLTGWADFWLVAARQRSEDGALLRDIDFFICDMNDPEQRIEVEELYDNLGLYLIPYGRNRIDLHVPKNYRLVPDRTGIMMMLDILHRSRIQFPGMGMGFVKRMLDEALDHCKKRFVGGVSLFNYNQVKQRIARIQASYTVCSAMCTYTSEHAALEEDLSRESLPANVTKSVVTDLMHDAAQSLLQLAGAMGYRMNHIAGRSFVDSRPFQIFEGSNDILYQQISEGVMKLMRRAKESNLYRYLTTSDLAKQASGYFKDLLNFDIDVQMPQRKLVELGRALGRIVSMDMVLRMQERGFRKDLLANCISVLQQDVTGLLSTYRHEGHAEVVEDYQENSLWLDFLKPSGGNDAACTGC